MTTKIDWFHSGEYHEYMLNIAVNDFRSAAIDHGDNSKEASNAMKRVAKYLTLCLFDMKGEGCHA